MNIVVTPHSDEDLEHRFSDKEACGTWATAFTPRAEEFLRRQREREAEIGITTTQDGGW